MISQVFRYPADEYRRNKVIKEILKKHKSISCFEIGKSVCGRSLPCLRIGDTKRYVLYTATYHGMEWLNTIIMLRFAECICTAIESGRLLYGFNLQEIISKRGVMIVPCVNPDGVEISLHGASSAGKLCKLVENICGSRCTFWQANACGVDINHNFNAGWKELKALEIENGIVCPACTRYGGEYPESEPETSAVVRLCNRFNFDFAFAFHSQGEVIYWNYGDTPSKGRTIADILAKASGYDVEEPSGLAVGGGFKDWFISRFYRPAFTVETGKGRNPLPLSDAVGIYEKIEEMLIISMGIFL